MGQKQNIRLIVTGGGTGGHLFPGIAVAEYIMTGHPGSRVLFVGTNRLLDTKTLAEREFETAAIVSHGLKGKSLASRMLALAAIPWSVLAAAKIIYGFKPNVVIGVGGYVTGPVVLAAKLMGIPTCIHEQNSVPGLANRMLGKFVDKIFVSIPGSEKYFPAAKTMLTGNPVRKELLEKAQDKQGRKNNKITVLVLGGSQGAHRINELVTEVVTKNRQLFQDDIELIHQTGARDEHWVSEVYNKAGVKAKARAFFTDMREAYNKADLVVSRAGATTLAEITALSKPSLLIPYPYAADDHQAQNGRYLVTGGAALMFRENELTADKLGELIIELTKDEDKRLKMAAAAGKLAKREATETITANCFRLAGLA